MNRKARNVVISVSLLLAVIIPVEAGSQVIGMLTIERLSLLDTYRTGARPFAMGGAYTAVSDDAFALLFNPAGLTQVEKSEITFGIQHLKLDIDNEYETWNSGSSNSYTSFGHLAMTTPAGSYGRNIVIGFGVFRVGSSDIEYIRKGLRPDLDGMIENIFLQSGSIYQYRFGIGAELVDNISVGATIVLWDESVKFTETLRFNETGTDSSYLYIDDSSAELDGISMEFGIMMWLNRYVRAGLTFSTPAALSYSGSGNDHYEGTFQDGTGWNTASEAFLTEDDLTLPMQFRGGLSFQSGYFLAAADISYCDYSQTKFNDLKLIDMDYPGNSILREVVNYNIGAEFTFPSAPLKLRAGYSYMPLKLQAMDELTYVIDTVDEWGLVTEYDYFDVNDERQFFTFGIGGIVDEVLILDLGLAFGSYERETRYLREKRDIMEIAITAGYRF
ncbi:MAG: hypothetical protein JW746_09295 [Candidatus Krumholzibacteriota bacterium]|nr:hypothetical protein [Candidatus Krumholzibacteriota bacterium]